MKRCLGVSLILLAVTLICGARGITVNSTADNGTGTLRWALQTARSGDVITFDPSVFPPDAPATIYVRSALPALRCGNLTIDASNASVILDGEQASRGEMSCLEIRSNGNVIQGLQIIGFSGCGMTLSSGAQENMIGGDRRIGTGPTGQGNLVCENNGGIGLWGSGTSSNVIIGNLIGTDTDDAVDRGNIDGIGIDNGASGNVIGPNNTIAYNREAGILVIGSDTVGNRITKNSIHSNDLAGIRFYPERDHPSNFAVSGINSEVGFISGDTCNGCTVEFFSDVATQGRFHEGSVIADEEGVFQISLGRAFRESSITATVTDQTGTTSDFLQLKHAAHKPVVLQLACNSPTFLLSHKVSSELQHNRIGDLWSGLWQPHDYQALFSEFVFGLGLKRMRISINSADVPTVDWTRPELSVAPIYDELISLLSEQGHEICYILSFWDKAHNTSLSTLPCSRFSTQMDLQRYLEFVRFIVRHFADRVQEYEIWNEPNVAPDCGQQIALRDYLNLVRSVVPVIREESPEARIVIGSVTSLPLLGAKDYLFGILESDVLPLVDGIAWHIGGPSLEYEIWADFWLTYPSVVREIKATAWLNGFVGEFIGDELIWRTPLNPHPLGAEQWLYSPIASAKYFARCIVMERGMDLTVGLAMDALEVLPYTVEVVRNLCTLLDNATPIELSIDTDLRDTLFAHCAFRYPNGDRILAVWTDGIAQDEDPGIPATIRFSGLAAQTVTGIDVLHGFEQELVFEIDGEDTVVRDLLVNDYPILIRLSDMTFGPDYQETAGDGFHRIGEPAACAAPDRDGDGVPDDEDFCPDWPGSPGTNGC